LDSINCETDAKNIIWQKLMINSAINPLTALLRVRNGELEHLPAAQSIIESVIKEVNFVYASTVQSDRPLPANSVASVMDVVSRTKENTSSMLKDILAGKESEVEQILGHICRVGQANHIPTPVCDTLRNLILSTSRLSTSAKPLTTMATRPPTPLVLNSVASFRKWRESSTVRNCKVGFVPTMGCLHEGHISLVKEAKKQCDFVVVSIFVNPTQFAAHEDLDKYPRTLDRDLELLTSAGADAVFAPSATEMYPALAKTVANGEKQLHETMSPVMIDPIGFDLLTFEGKSRPHFFRGVATVCTKLFNAVRPTSVYFGQKDFVQVSVNLFRLF
jgi:cytidyltransferase-like protein